MNEHYNELLKDLEKLELEKKELEKKIKSIQDVFKNAMDQLETLETDQYLVRYTLCENNTIKAKELEKDYPEIYRQYLKSTLYRRFSYKAI